MRDRPFRRQEGFHVAMATGPSIDVSGRLKEQLAQVSPDLLRAMSPHSLRR
jgi:hypothetical protein